MKTKVDVTAIAYSYLRFSSPAQAEGDSVRRQTALREAWLQRHPKVKLDNTLRLEDKGVSGFRGDHRTDPRHALAQFIDLVQRGRVPAGSYLIVENLDRLTREQPVVSIPAVLELIRLGIRVVQLAPTEMVYHADMDQGALMMMLFELSRGHGESKRKSGLSGEAWMEKKNEARTSRKPHGKGVPAWIELTEGKYRAKEDAARAIRLIFRWSAEGLGSLAIAARLNLEQVPPIARGQRWIRSYVAKILDNRAVLGEYQPMKGRHHRTLDGEPVPAYFPAVITEAEWHAAHAAKEARNKRSGRPGRKGDYLYALSGMLRCARDRCPVHVITRKGKRHLVSANAAQGVHDSHWCPFPLSAFVTAVLGQLRELQAADLFADPDGGKVTGLLGRLGEVEKKLAVALEHFDADPESPTWANQVDRYDREKRALTKELAEARQAAADPLSASWADAVTLMADEDPRRLRAALLATVAEVWCLFVARGEYRLAAVQVFFQGGARRDYLILYRGPKGGCVPSRPPQWWAQSLAVAAVPGDLDLRQPEHARGLEEALNAIDPTTLTDGACHAD